MAEYQRAALWAANGSRAGSLQHLAEGSNLTSPSMASGTVRRSSVLLQKPTFVELGSDSKQSNTRSVWAHSLSRKSSPTIVSCLAWAALRAGEDRRVQLCPRALSVLRRHLRLRESLEAAGEIDHEHVFFVETGEPFRSLHHPQRRWRKTLQSLKVRYRRPYTARQNSVSWSLMAGKNPLWVAKQHGHSIATMLRAYAAWAEGTAEVDVEAIKRSMNASEAPPAINLSVAEALQAKRALTTRSTRTSQSCANHLFCKRKMAPTSIERKLAGVAGLFGPAGLTPSGPPAAR
jgi:hypothetical protein